MSGIRVALLLVTGAIAAPAAHGQLPRLGAGGAALVVGSDPIFAGLGPAILARVDGQIRLRALALVGSRGDDWALRSEVVGELVFAPGLTNWSGFVGGGAALAVRPDDAAALVVMTIGFEQRPRGSRGWWIETGIGGGVRVGVGYRWSGRRAAVR